MIFASSAALAQDTADAALVAEISRIRVIDSHPERGNAWSPESPLGVSPYPDVVPLRRDNTDWIRAWRALYGYQFHDMQPVHLRQLLEAKRRLMLREATTDPATYSTSPAWTSR